MDASKVKKGRAEVLALARTVDRVIVARGKKAITFDMRAAVDEDALVEAMLGRTGNLKAPTLRLGRTLLVGFGEAAYQEVLG